jgi:hypothetical protein
LTLLRGQTPFSFSRIMTGDESWSLHLFQSDHMFAASRDEVIPRKRPTIGTRKVMVTIFFRSAKLISLQALPPRARFTQEYCIHTIRPDIVHERGQIFRRVHRGDFFVHLDNSMCHDGRKRPINLSFWGLTEFLTHLIRHTWVRATFDYSVCWSRTSSIGCFKRLKKFWTPFDMSGERWP